MNVLHLSTDDITGGAARAAHRLHGGLRGLGHVSSMLVVRRRSTDPSVIAFRPPKDLPSRWRRRLRRERIMRDLVRYRASRTRGYEHFSDDRSEHGAGLLSQLPACDVINLHWVARLVDYRSFFSAVPRHTPVVWTAHDMNAFTGGCHYDHGCGKYAERCGACPQLGSSDPDDLSRRIWQRKREVFQRVEPGRLHMVAPSRWMAAEVKRSSLLGDCPVTVIPNGLNLLDFAPRERSFARSVLSVPQDANALFYVADPSFGKRKGFGLLAEALAGVDSRTNPFLITVGSLSPAVDARIRHLHLGYVSNDRLLSLVYSAADVLVVPSLQDNLPNTVVESIACGVPVVGFAAGGIPDVVRPGVTGLLAPAGDVAALGRAIAQLLQDAAARAEMAANCRRVAIEEYSLEAQARRYLELYETLLAHRRGD